MIAISFICPGITDHNEEQDLVFFFWSSSIFLGGFFFVLFFIHFWCFVGTSPPSKKLQMCCKLRAVRLHPVFGISVMKGVGDV